MQLAVTYTATIYAIVDVEDGEVVDVLAHFDQRLPNPPFVVYEYYDGVSQYTLPEGPLRRDAVRIAEEAEWPSWSVE